MLSEGQKSWFLDIELERKGAKMIINRLMIPNTTVWKFYDKDMFATFITDSNLLPIESISYIATYYRYASATKEKFQECSSSFERLVQERVKIEGLGQLVDKKSQQSIEQDLQTMQILSLFRQSLSLQQGVFFTISSGYRAVFSMEKEVLKDSETADYYLRQAEKFERLAMQQDKGLVAVGNEQAKFGRSLASKVYRELNPSTLSTLHQISRKYMSGIKAGEENSN